MGHKSPFDLIFGGLLRNSGDFCFGSQGIPESSFNFKDDLCVVSAALAGFTIF